MNNKSTEEERIGDDFILERMYAREQRLSSQSDALDMKASYLLVVVAFLAQLSTSFLSKPNLPCVAKIDQWLSCISIAIAGAILLMELMVKSFDDESAEEMEPWRDKEISKAEAAQDAPHSSDYLRGWLTSGLIDGCKERIFTSEKNNKGKVRLLRLAYWCVAVAFMLDILFFTSPS
jgi:hypothetical protein